MKIQTMIYATIRPLEWLQLKTHMAPNVSEQVEPSALLHTASENVKFTNAWKHIFFQYLRN